MRLGDIMKKFINKNWKKLIYLITGITIIYNIYLAVKIPATIPTEFEEYATENGITTLADFTYISGEKIVETANNGINQLTNFVEEKGNLDNSQAKAVIFGVLLVCGVLIISNILDGSDSKPAPKKK